MCVCVCCGYIGANRKQGLFFESYLQKRNPHVVGGWKTRWFVLRSHKVMYFKDALQTTSEIKTIYLSTVTSTISRVLSAKTDAISVSSMERSSAHRLSTTLQTRSVTSRYTLSLSFSLLCCAGMLFCLTQRFVRAEGLCVCPPHTPPPVPPARRDAVAADVMAGPAAAGDSLRSFLPLAVFLLFLVF